MQECTWTGEQSRRNPTNLLIITTPSDLFGINCATGMSALMRKELLDNKGGFEAFGCYLAEDFFFAQAVQVGSWWQWWERRWQRWVAWWQWRRPYDNKFLATKVNCGQRALPQQMQERERYLGNFIHTLQFREQKCKTRKHKNTQKQKKTWIQNMQNLFRSRSTSWRWVHSRRPRTRPTQQLPRFRIGCPGDSNGARHDVVVVVVMVVGMKFKFG